MERVTATNVDDQLKNDYKEAIGEQTISEAIKQHMRETVMDSQPTNQDLMDKIDHLIQENTGQKQFEYDESAYIDETEYDPDKSVVPSEIAVDDNVEKLHSVAIKRLLNDESTRAVINPDHVDSQHKPANMTYDLIMACLRYRGGYLHQNKLLPFVTDQVGYSDTHVYENDLLDKIFKRLPTKFNSHKGNDMLVCGPDVAQKEVDEANQRFAQLIYEIRNELDLDSLSTGIHKKISEARRIAAYTRSLNYRFGVTGNVANHRQVVDNAIQDGKERCVDELRNELDKMVDRYESMLYDELEAAESPDEVDAIKSKMGGLSNDIFECMSVLESNGFAVDDGIRSRVRDVNNNQSDMFQVMRVKVGE